MQASYRNSKRFKRQSSFENELIIDGSSSGSSSGHFSASSLSNSPSCISAFNYCHLSSSASSTCSSSHKTTHHSRPSRKRSPSLNCNNNNNSASPNHFQTTTTTATNSLDPVYLEDDEVFFNLINRERCEMKQREQKLEENQEQDSAADPLQGQLRHSLLSWMLKVCVHQLCQDEVFSLATIILDKFLLFQDNRTITKLDSSEIEAFHCTENELDYRRLYSYAASSLLLASKMRQTPRLCVQVLIKFSQQELPIELSRDEILDGEMLILATLKWDLAALIAPNDFIPIVLKKCIKRDEIMESDSNKCDESKVRRHTQMLLDLCLMGK